MTWAQVEARVLKIVKSEDGRWLPSEISAEMSYPQSTVDKTLERLQAKGKIVKDADFYTTPRLLSKRLKALNNA